MNFWHIQMNQPWGRNSGTIDSIKMLQESPPVIGTGEWDHFQCRNFKNEDGTGLAIGDIVLVREASRPIALCKVTSNYYDDEELEQEYSNVWFRNVEILQWYNGNVSFPQPQGTLQRLSNTNSASWKFINNWYKLILANMETSKIADILKLKKQIILQGAPGTGKTYTTAALALSILDIEYDPSDHKDIMTKYN